MSKFKGKMEDNFEFGGIANRQRGLQLLAIFVSFSSTIASTGFRTSELQFSTKYNVTVPTAFFTQISLEKCWEECTARVACRAFNYYNLYKLCELDILGNLTDVSTSKPFEENGVVYWAKQELLATIPCGSKTCSLGQRCDKDTGECEIKECGPLNVSDDIDVRGNVNRIGSWIRLGCKEGYVPSFTRNIVECDVDGNWTTNDVTCKTCEPDWSKFQTSCYRRFLTPQTWYTASSECQQNNASLASITSEEEYVFVNAHLIDLNMQHVWIGAKKDINDDSLKWESGEPLIYRHFAPGEPNGGIREKCVSMKYNDGLRDYDGNSTTFSYLCEKQI